MRDFQTRNIHPEFDPLVEEALGHYVYLLCDGTTPFYVGKGGGTAGSGNTRLLDHFHEARAAASKSSKVSAKVRRILEIWETRDVEWFVLRRQIADQRTAFEIEAAAIDLLMRCGIALTNEQGGHYSGAVGLIASPSDVFANAAQSITCASFPADLCDRPIFVFNVKLAARANGGDYEAATREAWKVGHKFLELTERLPSDRKPIAIGVADGVSRAALIVDRWEQTNPGASSKERRWGIISDQDLSEQAKAHLVYRNFRELLTGLGYWQQGGWVAIEISGETGALTFLRGVKHKPGASS